MTEQAALAQEVARLLLWVLQGRTVSDTRVSLVPEAEAVQVHNAIVFAGVRGAALRRARRAFYAALEAILIDGHGLTKKGTGLCGL
ncbi:MAG: hypothetical protein M0004_17155 [Actinomycetota bacterium]|nr:hypothetical protein [Actinomycetota bacterium]